MEQRDLEADLSGLKRQLSGGIPSPPGPEVADLLERRARTYEALGRADEARPDWHAVLEFVETALAATPNEGEPVKNDWMVQAGGGDGFSEKTRSRQTRNSLWANRAINYAALGHPDLLARRADARRGLGDDDGARADLEQARTLVDHAIAECTDPDVLSFDLKLRAEILEHQGEEAAAVRDRLAAADVTEGIIPPSVASGADADTGIAAVTGARPGSDKPIGSGSAFDETEMPAHAVADAERRALIEEGRAVPIGSCQECGLVTLSHSGVDSNGHLVGATRLVAPADVAGRGE